MSRFIYTDEHLAFLKNGYLAMNIRDLTRAFNDRFGTGKTQKQIKTFVHNRGIISGRTGCFPRGNKPWNINTKGQGLTGQNKRSFKKGNVPANRKPLWSERICPKDGFIQMKVPERDPYTGSQARYRYKHVYIWEQAHGPVPEGKVVAFINSDKTRCELENLMLISRAELLNLNQHGYKDTPDSIKPSVLMLSKLQVKTWEREKCR